MQDFLQREKREEETPGFSTRGERFYATEDDVELSSELLDLTTKAFTKALTKDKWKELSASYTPIKRADEFMRAPTMEAGTTGWSRQEKNVGQVLSTAEPVEEPGAPQLPASRLTTPAADYLSPAHPLFLSENQTANRLGTFLTNWNILTTDKWILQNVSGGGFKSESLPAAVHFNTLPGGEKIGDRGIPSRDQIEGTEQISPQGEVQDGGASHGSLASPRGRLPDETRPQGCLLRSPNPQGIEEIPTLPVRGNNFRILLPPIRPLTGFQSLRKTPPSHYSETLLIGHTFSNLFGRSSPDSPSEGYSSRDLPLRTEALVQPGFHSETREMLFSPHASPSFPGCRIRHDSNVHCTARGTDLSDSGSMPGNARVPSNIAWEAVKLVRPRDPRSPVRSMGGTASLQSHTTAAGSISPPSRVETDVSDTFASSFPGGSNVVDVSSATLLQQPGHHLSSLRPHHQDRCIPAGVGCNLPGQNNRGPLKCGRGESAHKLPGTQGSDSCLEVIPGRRSSVTTPGSGPTLPSSHSSGDGQHHGSCVCEQKGGTRSPILSLLALELWSFLLTRGS
ncbi:hypothetical protein AWC38_SpisGene4194 [Stylophora pistillata]|uniref:Uncharacterized protein n=1 Tax=Stylophora pistillata TaxID=50429 RepID=A0A2B4SPB9_STYPI|nr:hypothetical protein AWC38_SpisGene4194 [Stylophora pistillata]